MKTTHSTFAVLALTLCANSCVTNSTQDSSSAAATVPVGATKPAAPPPAAEQRIIPPDRSWRPAGRTMTPTHITIHSTDNTDAGANARAHAGLLETGFETSNPAQSRTGYRTWHYTVDDKRVVQHLPLNEQGDHADFSGPGNRTSVGVEICVNNDGDQRKAVDNATRLTAGLLKHLNLGIDRVVPHHHWPQPPNGHRKPCPSILMDSGKPGPKWAAFKQKIEQYMK